MCLRLVHFPPSTSRRYLPNSAASTVSSNFICRISPCRLTWNTRSIDGQRGDLRYKSGLDSDEVDDYDCSNVPPSFIMNVPFPNYSSSNDQSLASLSTLPYQQGSEQTSCHLPPPQPTRGGLAYPHDLANYSSRPIDSSFPTALPTSTTPFSQNAYGSQVSSRHGLLQPSYSQSAHQFPIVQDLHHPTSPLSYQPPHGLQAQGRLPELLPMPIGGLTQSSGTSTNSMYSFSSASTNAHHEPPPTHVVGSQGRRGILPSAAGRPPAVSNGGVPNVKTSTLPAKDADGKFPCPHCSKTYLHAKHLKRHLLRRESYPTRPCAKLINLRHWR